MSFSGNLCMLFDKRIGKIGIIFRKQEKPSKEKIGNGSIVSDFSGYHIQRG